MGRGSGTPLTSPGTGATLPIGVNTKGQKGTHWHGASAPAAPSRCKLTVLHHCSLRQR